jgi:putative ABC transport system permease protein
MTIIRRNIWLALLALCMVFAATAGARETVVDRSDALHQTLAAAPALDSTVTVTGTASLISEALGKPQTPMPENFLSALQGELHGDLDGGALDLAPAAGDWISLVTAKSSLVLSNLQGTDGMPVTLFVDYRQPLASHVRLVAGTQPGTPQGASGEVPYPVLPVLVTQQTAEQFHLGPGSRVQVADPWLSQDSITLEVTGIAAALAPGSAFWASDTTVLAPAVANPPNQPPKWVAGVLAGPGAAEALQADFDIRPMNSDVPAGSGPDVTAQWAFPLAVDELRGEQTQAVTDTLTRLSSQQLPLSPGIQPAATQLTVASGLPSVLLPFIAAAQSADVLLWLLYVSLILAGLVVLLLAGRMVVVSRAVQLTLLRARGASLWQLAVATGGEAALCCVPAAAAGVALGLLAVPSAGGPQPLSATGTWWPVAAVLLTVIGGPAAATMWLHRLARGRSVVQRQPRARVRPVVEVMLVLAAAGGVLLLRKQGLHAGSGVNPYASAAPALVAVPAVIVVFRLYPLVLRWLLRSASGTAGAAGFLGLARAARTALTPALPSFALVLALTITAFGGMVRGAVDAGETAASWATVSADVEISLSQLATGATIPGAVAQQAAAVPGVTRAARIWQSPWSASDGTQVTVIAVDPAAYAAVTAAAPGYPAMAASALAAPSGADAAQPVLASPAAAAALGSGTVKLSTTAGVQPVAVRIAGTLATTPALPPASTLAPYTPAFVILPFSALRSSATPPRPVQANEMLLDGPGVDRAKLAKVIGGGIAGASISYRSDVLARLQGAPLQHGAVTMITLATVVAALLGLAIMLLELALSAPERDATLTRLATMGLGEGQRARVVALELLPAVTAAGLGAVACAYALPPLVRPVIDLSVFTGGSAAASLTPDLTVVGLPLAGLILLAALALGIEIGAGRRRGAASALRIDG